MVLDIFFLESEHIYGIWYMVYKNILYMVYVYIVYF